MRTCVNRIVVALFVFSCVCGSASLSHAAELAEARAYTARPTNPEAVVDDAFARAKETIERIIAIPEQKRTFRNTVWALDDLVAQLQLHTNMIQFMAYVSPDPEQRAIGEVTLICPLARSASVRRTVALP